MPDPSQGQKLGKRLRPGLNRARVPVAALAVALFGCSIHPKPGAGDAPLVEDDPAWGLATPATIAGWDRVDLAGVVKPGAGVTAGYSHITGDDVDIATIRVHPAPAGNTLLPSLDRAGSITPDASAQALDASIAQVRRYYKAAEIVAKAPAFLLQKGVLQPGQTATLEYQEHHAGQLRAVRLKLYTFCCGDGRWSYEYRFRYPAGLDDQFAIAEFMRATSWAK